MLFLWYRSLKKTKNLNLYALWELSSNRPEGVHIYIYILSKLQSPAFIHFKVQFFAVFRRSQYWTIPLCIRGWWRKTEMAISRKKKTVTWGEVRQLFFTMISKKPKRKTYVSRVTRVQSDSHGHTLVTIMNSPLVVLFSNVHQISFWKD